MQDGAKLIAKPVVVGNFNDQFIEIRSGLSEGDLVILEPLSAVKDGAAVEPGAPS